MISIYYIKYMLYNNTINNIRSIMDNLDNKLNNEEDLLDTDKPETNSMLDNPIHEDKINTDKSNPQEKVITNPQSMDNLNKKEKWKKY